MPIDDDDSVVGAKSVQQKIDAIANKPCKWWHCFAAFGLGFIAGAWLFM